MHSIDTRIPADKTGRADEPKGVRYTIFAPSPQQQDIGTQCPSHCEHCVTENVDRLFLDYDLLLIWDFISI